MLGEMEHAGQEEVIPTMNFPLDEKILPLRKWDEIGDGQHILMTHHKPHVLTHCDAQEAESHIQDILKKEQ